MLCHRLTAERKRPLVCRQRKDTRQSLTPLLLCQVPTRLRTSVGLGLTRYAKRPVPPPRPRDDNIIRRRVDPNTLWLYTPPTDICLCLCSLPFRYFQPINKKKSKPTITPNNATISTHHESKCPVIRDVLKTILEICTRDKDRSF